MKKELELFTTRYSCRNFKKGKILKEKKLKTLLELARLSPSSLGLEPWNFVVCKDKTKLKELSEIANHQEHVKNASAVIIIVSRLDFAEYFEEKLRKRKMSEDEIQKRIQTYKPFLTSMNEEQKLFYAREQAHIALGTILYGANALNIASCAIGGFDKDKLDNYLKLDTQKQRATLMIALGVSADKKPPQKQRFSFEEVVKFI